MAINKNFVVKNGLEVNTDQIFADSSSGKVGIGSTLPTVELDVQGAIAATDITSSLLRVTGYSTLPQTTVNDNLTVLGFTTAINELNVLGISSLSNLRVVGVATFENDVNVTGFSTFVGFSTFNDYVTIQDGLNVSGVSTFTGAADFNSNVDIDGHTELDDVNVSGASTFTGAIDANGDIDVDGFTELDATNISETLNVVGVSTFESDVDINASIDVDGHTELDNLNVSGVSTFTGAADFNGNVDIDGHTELDDVNVSGVSTFSSLSAVGGVVAVGVGKSLVSYDNIVVGDAGINVSGTVTATSFTGSFSGAGINIGIQSGGSTVSTATSTINFDIINGTITAAASDGGAGITTVTVIIPTEDSVGIATEAVRAGMSTESTRAGIATQVDGYLGVGVTGTNLNVTGIITANSFSGSLNGNATSATSATSATTATNVTVTANNSTNETVYPVFVDGATGSQGAETDTSLTYNPSTNTLTAGTFSGDGSGLTGIASTDDVSTSSLVVSGISTLGNVTAGIITAQDFNSTSDNRIKTNVKTVDNAVEIVNSLRGVSFDWKESGLSSYGVIAQELEKVLPELVKDNTIKSVNYNGLVGILIEAIKELSLKVERLRNNK